MSVSLGFIISDEDKKAWQSQKDAQSKAREQRVREAADRKAARDAAVQEYKDKEEARKKAIEELVKTGVKEKEAKKQFPPIPSPSIPSTKPLCQLHH